MELKVLTCNMWLLPKPFAIHQRNRIKRLIKMVRRCGPQVVALQEVWLHKYVKAIQRALPGYTFFYSNRGWFNRSGLVTLVRANTVQNPGRQLVFRTTEEHSFIESFGKKGFIRVEFEYGGDRISVVNTHLYAPLSRRDVRITKGQFKRIREATLLDHTVVVAGDLNLELDCFNKQNKGHFISGSNTPTFSSKNRYARFSEGRKRFKSKLDYILLRGYGKIKSEVIKYPEVTDHWAVLGRILLG